MKRPTCQTCVCFDPGQRDPSNNNWIRESSCRIEADPWPERNPHDWCAKHQDFPRYAKFVQATAGYEG